MPQQETGKCGVKCYQNFHKMYCLCHITSASRDTLALVPKCLGSELSWIRSVCTPLHILVVALLSPRLRLISQLPNLLIGTPRICNFYFVVDHLGAFF